MGCHQERPFILGASLGDYSPHRVALDACEFNGGITFIVMFDKSPLNLKQSWPEFFGG
jgi:hypothetical protein